MINAEVFKQIFGIYATELWAMSEKDFLEWLNAKYIATDSRPKGKWLYHRASNGLVVVKCSECKKTYGFLKTNYCPNCGKI